MKNLNTLIIGSLTALVLSNNVKAEETIFNNNDIQNALNNSIKFAINDMNAVNVKPIVKQQLASIHMEQSAQPFLELIENAEQQKPTVALISE